MDDTFGSLIKTLERRYENKQLIADKHINEILNLESIKFKSAKELRKLNDSITKHTRILKRLKLE